ncbi:MAG: glycosyltransferase [Dehalococcoidia bacterium]
MLDVLLYEAYSGKATGNIRYLLDLARFGSEYGIRLHVAVPADFAVLDEAREIGVPCTVISPGNRLMRYGGLIQQERALSRMRTAWAMVRYWGKLRAWTGRSSPQVLLTNNLRSHLLAAPAVRSRGIPAVWYVTGETESVPLGRLAFRLAARVLFQSELTVDRRLASPKAMAHKQRIVPNGVDVERILAIANAGCADLRKPDSELWLTCVARLSRPKGIAVLIDAFEQIAREDGRVRLILVGDTGREIDIPFVAEIRSRIAESGLTDKVRMLGWREDAAAIVALSDVVVHPSFTEGMPKAIIEAMVIGRPVIASAVGGIPDFVRDGETGFLVPAGDPAALARALSVICSDAALRRDMGFAASLFARRRTIEANVRALASVLTDVVAENGRTRPDPPRGR